MLLSSFYSICTLPCYPFPVCKQLYNMNSMMGKVFTSHMKALKLREVKQRAFQFKSIQAQYGLTTGLHTRAESFCARQRHTALVKRSIIIIFFSYIFSLTVYYLNVRNIGCSVSIQSRLPSNELSHASCPKTISNCFFFFKRYHFNFHFPALF